jgi:hypothetical protein
VQNHNNTLAESEHDFQTESIEPPQFPWHAEVGQLLTQTAALCVQHGVDLETFMKGAWSAYVESRPGLRDYLEEMQLRDQLAEIRRTGRMGEA